VVTEFTRPATWEDRKLVDFERRWAFAESVRKSTGWAGLARLARLSKTFDLVRK